MTTTTGRKRVRNTRERNTRANIMRREKGKVREKAKERRVRAKEREKERAKAAKAREKESIMPPTLLGRIHRLVPHLSHPIQQRAQRLRRRR